MEFVNYVLEKNVLLVYIVFLASAYIQMLFPAYPGDVVLVFQGYLTTVSGSFGIAPILLISLAGTFAGSLTVYRFGFSKGDKVFENRMVRKYVKDSQREKAGQLFNKYGSVAILLSKFIPGISVVMLLFAGIFKVKSSQVYIAAGISIIIHDVVCVWLGVFLGNNMSRVKHIFSAYNTVILIIIGILILVYVSCRFVSGRRSGHEKV